MPIACVCGLLSACDPVWLMQREVEGRVAVTADCVRAGLSHVPNIENWGVSSDSTLPRYAEYWVSRSGADSVSARLDSEAPHKVVLSFGSKDRNVPPEFENTRALLLAFQNALVVACALPLDQLVIKDTCMGTVCDSPQVALEPRG